MKDLLKKWLRPILFTGGGALAGLAYYALVGCPTGSCAITSSPREPHGLHRPDRTAALRRVRERM